MPTSIKERPILFSAQMIRAILENRKTQTRRVLKVQPPDEYYQFSTCVSTTGDKRDEGRHHWVLIAEDGCNITDAKQPYFSCPYGQPGDRLWVRETWAWPGEEEVIYRADPEFAALVEKWKTDPNYPQIKWSPAIFCPRKFSRITLEITKVRVERLQDITCGGVMLPSDIVAEGCPRDIAGDGDKEIKYWVDLWNSINNKRGFGWDANPFVWVIEFRKLENFNA
jgi:hypothetical protein